MKAQYPPDEVFGKVSAGGVAGAAGCLRRVTPQAEEEGLAAPAQGAAAPAGPRSPAARRSPPQRVARKAPRWPRRVAGGAPGAGCPPSRPLAPLPPPQPAGGAGDPTASYARLLRPAQKQVV